MATGNESAIRGLEKAMSSPIRRVNEARRAATPAEREGGAFPKEIPALKYKEKIGKYDGCTVYLVSGAEVRKYLTMFDGGGNCQAYPSMPANEIWVERMSTPDDTAFILAHELIEYTRMKYAKEAYPIAHNNSNDAEACLRAADDTYDDEQKFHKTHGDLAQTAKSKVKEGVDADATQKLRDMELSMWQDALRSFRDGYAVGELKEAAKGKPVDPEAVSSSEKALYYHHEGSPLHSFLAKHGYKPKEIEKIHDAAHGVLMQHFKPRKGMSGSRASMAAHHYLNTAEPTDDPNSHIVRAALPFAHRKGAKRPSVDAVKADIESRGKVHTALKKASSSLAASDDVRTGVSRSEHLLAASGRIDREAKGYTHVPPVSPVAPPESVPAGHSPAAVEPSPVLSSPASHVPAVHAQDNGLTQSDIDDLLATVTAHTRPASSDDAARVASAKAQMHTTVHAGEEAARKKADPGLDPKGKMADFLKVHGYSEDQAQDIYDHAHHELTHGYNTHLPVERRAAVASSWLNNNDHGPANQRNFITHAINAHDPSHRPDVADVKAAITTHAQITHSAVSQVGQENVVVPLGEEERKMVNQGQLGPRAAVKGGFSTDKLGVLTHAKAPDAATPTTLDRHAVGGTHEHLLAQGVAAPVAREKIVAHAVTALHTLPGSPLSTLSNEGRDIVIKHALSQHPDKDTRHPFAGVGERSVDPLGNKMAKGPMEIQNEFGQKLTSNRDNVHDWLMNHAEDAKAKLSPADQSAVTRASIAHDAAAAARDASGVAAAERASALDLASQKGASYGMKMRALHLHGIDINKMPHPSPEHAKIAADVKASYAPGGFRSTTPSRPTRPGPVPLATPAPRSTPTAVTPAKPEDRLKDVSAALAKMKASNAPNAMKARALAVHKAYLSRITRKGRLGEDIDESVPGGGGDVFSGDSSVTMNRTLVAPSGTTDTTNAGNFGQDRVDQLKAMIAKKKQQINTGVLPPAAVNYSGGQDNRPPEISTANPAPSLQVGADLR